MSGGSRYTQYTLNKWFDVSRFRIFHAIKNETKEKAQQISTKNLIPEVVSK